VDEIFVLFDIAAVVLLGFWLFILLRPTHHLHRAWRARVTVVAALALSLAIIVYVLLHWASFDVVGDPYYVLGYLSLGLLCIIGATKAQSVVADVWLQQDVRDRNNLAAGVAFGGLLLGNAAAYAGGNVGDGPGWYVVLFSVLLSVGAVTASIGLFAAWSDGEERITIDHDVGAALRLAAVAIGAGVIAGRAAAGNWVSVDATTREFIAVAWPIVPLVGAAIAHERLTPPVYAETGDLRSFAFAAVVVAGACGYVSQLGPP